MKRVQIDCIDGKSFTFHQDRHNGTFEDYYIYRQIDKGWALTYSNKVDKTKIVINSNSVISVQIDEV